MKPVIAISGEYSSEGDGIAERITREPGYLFVNAAYMEDWLD